MDIGGSRRGISGGAGTGLAPFIPQNVSAEVCAHCVLRLLGERCHGRGCRAQLLCNAEVPLHLPALPNAAHLILELIPCSIFQARPGGAAVSPLAFLMCSLRFPCLPGVSLCWQLSCRAFAATLSPSPSLGMAVCGSGLLGERTPFHTWRISPGEMNPRERMVFGRTQTSLSPLSCQL